MKIFLSVAAALLCASQNLLAFCPDTLTFEDMDQLQSGSFVWMGDVHCAANEFERENMSIYQQAENPTDLNLWSSNLIGGQGFDYLCTYSWFEAADPGLCWDLEQKETQIRKDVKLYCTVPYDASL